MIDFTQLQELMLLAAAKSSENITIYDEMCNLNPQYPLMSMHSWIQRHFPLEGFTNAYKCTFEMQIISASFDASECNKISMNAENAILEFDKIYVAGVYIIDLDIKDTSIRLMSKQNLWEAILSIEFIAGAEDKMLETSITLPQITAD